MKLAAIIIPLLLFGCAVESTVLSDPAHGAQVQLTLSDSSTVSGELIAIDDSLVLLADPAIRTYLTSGVITVTTPVPEGKNRWIVPWFLVQLAPTLVIWTEVSDSKTRQPSEQQGFNTALLIAIGITATTAVLFLTSDPGRHDLPGNEGTIPRLAGYARYPQGMTAEQRSMLVKHGEQVP